MRSGPPASSPAAALPRPSPLAGYRALNGPGRVAFWAAFAGYGLAAFDLLSFTFVLPALQADLGLSEGQAGMLATASLLASAVGGVLAGGLADRIGRARTMQLAVAAYAVATLLCALAQDYQQLLLFRVLLGLGFGGEWTASALLVAEYAQPASRGSALGLLACAFSVGDALAAVAYAGLAHLAPPDLGWRILFGLGVLPALLLVWIRARVVESPVYLEEKRARCDGAEPPRWPGLGALGRIFRRDLLVTTVAATALAAGALGGRYVITVWLPTYLRAGRDLDATAASIGMLPVLLGSLLGYVAGGDSQDRLGRRPTFAVFAIASAAAIWFYVRAPGGSDVALAAAGLVLGFCTAGALSGLGAYLSELFPTAIRGIGQGFTYSVGRAAAAIPVVIVGDLATGEGLGPAIAVSAVVYVVCLAALGFLPETRGKNLSGSG